MQDHCHPAIHSLPNAEILGHLFIHRIKDFLNNNAGTAHSRSMSTFVSISRLLLESFRSIATSSKFQGKVGQNTILFISSLSHSLSYNFLHLVFSLKYYFFFWWMNEWMKQSVNKSFSLKKKLISWSTPSLLATFNCKMVAIKKNQSSKKNWRGGHFMTYCTKC